MNPWKLFLDDDADTVRRPDITVENSAWRKTMDLPLDPPNTDPAVLGDWKIARSYVEAAALFDEFGLPLFVSFDHDLADGKDGIAVAHRMIEIDMDSFGGQISRRFRFEVHSGNRVGRDNIRGLLEGYMKQKTHWSGIKVEDGHYDPKELEASKERGRLADNAVLKLGWLTEEQLCSANGFFESFPSSSINVVEHVMYDLSQFDSDPEDVTELDNDDEPAGMKP
ncbi:cyclic-phosphate processing receiver domain-containing protein [Roseibium aggregatum]|uniref:Cyclic-phosphate processing Receiver domain-containing protein n=1 Tax=Roseibium aggregatum TaxID=187304 RepID=A0A0M6YB84_9HYPH|nr:cyclic-phosphate processing receiver domain-containing protein [Roseibium aggregatum]CTQ47346.1 hypothetical protein LAL4801_05808 [Roseibium aggregatum]